MKVPVGVIFNPNWWFRNYGISFGREFYLDAGTRIRNDIRMRRALYDRFGLGSPDAGPRPIIGSRHVAGGFVVPALLGAEIRFACDQAPWPVARNLSRQEALALRKPPVAETWPMDALLAAMDLLEHRFGSVIGDLNTDGVLNTALVLRGQELFLDMLEAPEVADHLFRLVAETQAEVAHLVRSRTGTSSVSTNRCILHADAAIYLHSNCSVQMISPKLFRERLLAFDRELAARLTPYGIHHCGNNLHLFAGAYSELPCAFVDVGWGSDVALCSRAFPDAFLNLRLSPVRMLHETAEQIRRDARDLLCRAGRASNVGLCCINMDYGTPDENVRAMLKVGG